MKKTIITALVAVAAFGFSGTSFAGSGWYNGGQNGNPGAPSDGNDVLTTILTAMTNTNTQDNDSWNFDPDVTTSISSSVSNNITVHDVVAAVATSTAPAYAALGDLSVATAEATQYSSFPMLTTVVTPVVGLGVSALGSGQGTDGLTLGNVNVSGAVGSGVGANIGGAVFESINTATAIAINGTLGTN
jgi:hypothetical protein